MGWRQEGSVARPREGNYIGHCIQVQRSVDMRENMTMIFFPANLRLDIFFRDAKNEPLIGMFFVPGIGDNEQPLSFGSAMNEALACQCVTAIGLIG